MSFVRALLSRLRTPRSVSRPSGRGRLRLEGLEDRLALSGSPSCDPCPPPAQTCCQQTSCTDPGPAPGCPAPSVQPVLLVIANRDFYYREYADTRTALEAAGVSVRVAAATDTLCVPHWNSGQGAGGGYVDPDLAVTQADAADYSAVVFVGGWGASSYQYAFEGTYAYSTYNGAVDVRQAVNELINDFVCQDKYVAGLCHGVSVLAYARVDGRSLLEGRQVSIYEGWSPQFTLNGQTYAGLSDRWHVQANGGTTFAPGGIGDPRTDADDVWVDGKIITGQNFNSATRFGEVIAAQVLAATP